MIAIALLRMLSTPDIKGEQYFGKVKYCGHVLHPTFPAAWCHLKDISFKILSSRCKSPKAAGVRQACALSGTSRSYSSPWPGSKAVCLSCILLAVTCCREGKYVEP